MAGIYSSFTADDDLSALLEDSEQLERETCGSTEAALERPISVLARINTNSKKYLPDRQLTKNDEIAGIKLLERLGCNTDSFDLMRQELQRANWMVTTTAQSTNVAEWLTRKYVDIRDDTMKATRKKLNQQSQDALTNYIYSEWNQKVQALDKIRQGDQFLDNIDQSARKAKESLASSSGASSTSLVPAGRTPSKAPAAVPTDNRPSPSDSASALVHTMIHEIAADNTKPGLKGFLTKTRGPRSSGGHWRYVLGQLFSLSSNDTEHDMERRALFAARWFLEEQKPLPGRSKKSKSSREKFDLGRVVFKVLRHLRGNLLGPGDLPGSHPSVLKDVAGRHREVDSERRQLVQWVTKTLERLGLFRDREPRGVGGYKTHVAKYIQRANYPKNPNNVGTHYRLAGEAERTEWKSSDNSFQEIVASLLYSGRPNERRPKQLKSNSQTDEFYTEDFLWYQLAFLAGCEDDLATDKPSAASRDKYRFSASLKRFRSAIKGKIQDLDSVGDLCLLSAWLPEAAIDFAARKDETQLATYAALYLYKRCLLQVAWDVDERPSSGTVFLTSAGGGAGPLGRTSYLRLGALVSLFTKFRSTQEDQVRHQIPFWIQFWKTSEYWTHNEPLNQFWPKQGPRSQVKQMYEEGMRFAEKQLQEIVISLIRGNVLTAKTDWLKSIAGPLNKDNYFRRPFAFAISGKKTGGNREAYTGLVPMAVACTNAAYEAKSYGLNQQALDLFILVRSEVEASDPAVADEVQRIAPGYADISSSKTELIVAELDQIITKRKNSRKSRKEWLQNSENWLKELSDDPDGDRRQIEKIESYRWLVLAMEQNHKPPVNEAREQHLEVRTRQYLQRLRNGY